jgi:hypothetical protein
VYLHHLHILPPAENPPHKHTHGQSSQPILSWLIVQQVTSTTNKGAEIQSEGWMRESWWIVKGGGCEWGSQSYNKGQVSLEIKPSSPQPSPFHSHSQLSPRQEAATATCRVVVQLLPPPTRGLKFNLKDFFRKPLSVTRGPQNGLGNLSSKGANRWQEIDHVIDKGGVVNEVTKATTMGTSHERPCPRTFTTVASSVTANLRLGERPQQPAPIVIAISLGREKFISLSTTSPTTYLSTINKQPQQSPGELYREYGWIVEGVYANEEAGASAKGNIKRSHKK